MDNAIGYLLLCKAWSHLLEDLGLVNGHGEAMDILEAAKMRVIDDGIPDGQFALIEAMLRVTDPSLSRRAAL